MLSLLIPSSNLKPWENLIIVNIFQSALSLLFKMVEATRKENMETIPSSQSFSVDDFINYICRNWQAQWFNLILILNIIHHHLSSTAYITAGLIHQCFWFFKKWVYTSRADVVFELPLILCLFRYDFLRLLGHYWCVSFFFPNRSTLYSCRIYPSVLVFSLCTSESKKKIQNVQKKILM